MFLTSCFLLPKLKTFVPFLVAERVNGKMVVKIQQKHFWSIIVLSFFLLSSVTANEELIATIVEEAPLDVHALPQLTKTNTFENKSLRGISIADSNRSNKNENIINKVNIMIYNES